MLPLDKRAEKPVSWTTLIPRQETVLHQQEKGLIPVVLLNFPSGVHAYCRTGPVEIVARGDQQVEVTTLYFELRPEEIAEGSTGRSIPQVALADLDNESFQFMNRKVLARFDGYINHPNHVHRRWPAASHVEPSSA